MIHSEGIFFLPKASLRTNADFMKSAMESEWLGLKSYQEGLEIQTLKHKITGKTKTPFLLGLEHQNVLSLGLRSHKDSDSYQFTEDFEVFLSRRGGHATIHNPGQLVIYPIVPLREWKMGVSDFVCLLIKTTKALLSSYGVESFEKGEPGLFTKNGKIALFGIQVSQGVSLHGLALNVNNDLTPFSQIPVCNVKGESMDRLSHYKQDLDLSHLFSQWAEIFKGKL